MIVKFNCSYDSDLTQIIFENSNQPPPGYVSVPAGNVYITRNCRRLTKKSGRSVYAIYVRTLTQISICFSNGLPFRQRDQYLDERTTHIGIHVPKDVFEQVRSDYENFRTRSSKSLWRRLYKEYPKMPLADKTEVHRIITSQYLEPTAKSTLKKLELRVHCYARDSYTPYKSLLEKKGSVNKKEWSKIYERLKDIMVSWRGQN